MNLPELSLTKYKNTRYFALHSNQELLAVVCYKKGGEAIVNFIHNLVAENKAQNQEKTD